MTLWIAPIPVVVSRVGLEYPRFEEKMNMYISCYLFAVIVIKYSPLIILWWRLEWLQRMMEFYYETIFLASLGNTSRESRITPIFLICSMRLYKCQCLNYVDFHLGNKLTHDHVNFLLGWVSDCCWTNDRFDHHSGRRKRPVQIHIITVSREKIRKQSVFFDIHNMLAHMWMLVLEHAKRKTYLPNNNYIWNPVFLKLDWTYWFNRESANPVIDSTIVGS